MINYPKIQPIIIRKETSNDILRNIAYRCNYARKENITYVIIFEPDSQQEQRIIQLADCIFNIKGIIIAIVNLQ